MVQYPFPAYRRELAPSDLQPQTLERYGSVLTSYEDWLQGRFPTTQLGKAFIAALRLGGYTHASIGLFASVIRPFHAFLGDP